MPLSSAQFCVLLHFFFFLLLFYFVSASLLIHCFVTQNNLMSLQAAHITHSVIMTIIFQKKAQPNPIQTKQNTTPKPNQNQQKQINSPLHPQPTIPTSQQNRNQTQMKQTKKATNRITLQGRRISCTHFSQIRSTW